jgi:hypothetical protein
MLHSGEKVIELLPYEVSKSFFDAEVFSNPLRCLNPFLYLIVIDENLTQSSYYTE